MGVAADRKGGVPAGTPAHGLGHLLAEPANRVGDVLGGVSDLLVDADAEVTALEGARALARGPKVVVVGHAGEEPVGLEDVSRGERRAPPRLGDHPGPRDALVVDFVESLELPREGGDPLSAEDLARVVLGDGAVLDPAGVVGEPYGEAVEPRGPLRIREHRPLAAEPRVGSPHEPVVAHLSSSLR